MLKISVDAHGGDNGLKTTIPASINALNNNNNLFLYLVGDEIKITTELEKNNNFSKIKERIKIIHTTQIIEMDESPIKALRGKKDSSMCIAIKLVKEGVVSACVSAGNTGALMTISRSTLKMIPGISRPAIFGKIPTEKGFTHMLDLGADINNNPTTLLEFAIMGSTAVQYECNISKPSIGLLNIGVEEIKGTKEIKEASELLKNSELNYVGFIEGDDIYKGAVNVVVTDGFVGNIALKASEGAVHMMSYYLKKSFTNNLFSKFIALISKPVLNQFKKTLDHRNYNGASFLGLNGIVIKSHGSADCYSFEQAIKTAEIEATHNLPEKIKNNLNGAKT
ncbi:Phosphate:acyl-ACP acyltransferase PlsX [hydrothermal vent metagenome]|uniref:phosphate acyltransferase n=1 Tax=hydrothermal vent metagenome TaxID=652676 RepID=A0A1W1C560_9ZZZZ